MIFKSDLNAEVAEFFAKVAEKSRPLRSSAKTSASCSENKSGFQANFNGPCDLQSVSCRDVGGSTDGCRGSVQLVVEKNNSE